MVNGREVSSREVSLAEAKAIKGLRAVFGEVGFDADAAARGELLLLLCCLRQEGGTEGGPAAALLWGGRT